MECNECKYGKKNKCDLKSDDAVRDVIAQNNKLLYDISTANKPRFEDTEGVEQKFKSRLNSFFDVLSVLYSISMEGYFPVKEASEEQISFYLTYSRYRDIAYENCIQQAQMRILTLGRASCGFVGEFSSGKTSYLNTEVFGGDILPVSSRATTSIPTYIFPGRSNRVVLENMRGNIQICPDFTVLKMLVHSAKPEGCPCRFQWDAVIKRLFCFSTGLAYDHELVYVDLPGYAATSDDNRSMKEAIEGCDKIVYFKSVSSGELNEKDIEYLTAIHEKAVIIVLSKADQKPSKECIAVQEKVKSTLSDRGIKTEGVILYTARPEVFASDQAFSRCLRQYRETLKKFIQNTSAMEEDINLPLAMMKYYLEEFREHENNIISFVNVTDEAFDAFLGKRELDDAFFNIWKKINKDIADSGRQYVDSHFFSANTVRIGDYLNANLNRAYNFYISDTYDSGFNTSYQEALYGNTLYYLYKTALYMQITGNEDSNYEEACKKIDFLKENYKVLRKCIDAIYSRNNQFFEYHKGLTTSIVEDAKCAFEAVKKSYGELLNYVINYEKGWNEA